MVAMESPRAGDGGAGMAVGSGRMACATALVTFVIHRRVSMGSRAIADGDARGAGNDAE